MSSNQGDQEEKVPFVYVAEPLNVQQVWNLYVTKTPYIDKQCQSYNYK